MKNKNSFISSFFPPVPTIPSGNIHAPVVMVAEKGADLIKELWLQEGVIRAERAAAKTVKVAHVAEVVETVAASAKKANTVYANATAA